MSNFIEADIAQQLDHSKLKSFKNIYGIHKKRNIHKWIWVFLLILIVILFLPWTQNIRGLGRVTTLRQEQRPQEINTIIPGRIVKWYVKEGDYVNKGDTILQLGEVKTEYFDAALLQNTQQQINAKDQSINAYKNKAYTTDTQEEALQQGRVFKLQSVDNKLDQQKLKVATNLAELTAANNEILVYKRQVNAAKLMLDSGVISLIDFEKRNINSQNSIAKRISAENKYEQSKQELDGLLIEKNSIVQEYTDKIFKTRGDKYTALSQAASTEAEKSKLQNAYANYDRRNQLYYVLASQYGQLVNARKAGIGEILKEGEMIAEIVPVTTEHAVELFVNPMDLPLVNKGQKVTFVFDGFPAIVFSGWPNSSFGSFYGIVSSVETSVNINGKFRVLVVEAGTEKKWPPEIKMGVGANGIILLKDVRVYYELWRNINGFPPNYYLPGKKATKP